METSSSDMSSGMSEIERIPADLLPVLKVWPDLPEHLKAAILTLANSVIVGQAPAFPEG